MPPFAEMVPLLMICLPASRIDPPDPPPPILGCEVETPPPLADTVAPDRIVSVPLLSASNEIEPPPAPPPD